MNTDKKPRADATLKLLPAERQAAIADFLAQPGNTLDKGVAWLRADGFKTSKGTLSRWWHWYASQQELQEANDTLEAFEDFLRQQKPGWTADKIRDTAIQFFISQTVGQKDVNKFATVVQLDQNERFGRTKAMQKEREITLKENKFQFDAAKLALAAVQKLKAISTSKLSDVEKITQARLALFGELPAEPTKTK